MAANTPWPRLFVRLFGTGAAVIVAVAVSTYQLRRDAALDQMRDDKIMTLAAQSAFFSDVLRRIAADTTILTHQNVFEEPGDDSLWRAARHFGIFAQAIGNYRSIRLLDAEGREMLESAVDSYGTVYTRIAPGDTPMPTEVAAAAALPEGVTLMRPDVEANADEPRPICHIVAPVASGMQGPRRYLATTYRFDLLFDRLFRLSHNTAGTLIVATPQGFWSTPVGDAGLRWRYDRADAGGPEPLRAHPEV